VLRYRRVAVPATEHKRLRRAFSSAPEFPLRTLCAVSSTAIQTVLRLVLGGTLHIDWWEPLGPDSKVSITPIGRQIWPCPPAILSQTNSQEAKCQSMC
jgi:hypothetical protein